MIGVLLLITAVLSAAGAQPRPAVKVVTAYEAWRPSVAKPLDALAAYGREWRRADLARHATG